MPGDGDAIVEVAHGALHERIVPKRYLPGGGIRVLVDHEALGVEDGDGGVAEPQDEVREGAGPLHFTIRQAGGTPG